MKTIKASSLFKFFSSLKLAVFSILLLATVLAIATVLESYYGMRAVHVLVYGTWWFAGCLILLGVNVTCAALSRYPWKRHQTGFAITHLGIIVLLVGSFMTQQWGVDGSLPVIEGSQENEVILTNLELSVVDEKNGTALRYPIRDAALPRKENWLQLDIGPEHSLIVDQYLPRALPNKKFIESPSKTAGSPAIQIEIANERFQISEWIIDQNPVEGATLNLGPAVIKFRQLWTEEDKKKFLAGKKEETKPIPKDSPGYVVLSFQGKEFRIEFPEAMKKWAPISGTDLEVKIDRYLAYAVVEKNELINKSEDPVNPTVQLLIRKKDSESEPEKHTVFANFPEFTTLHGQHKLGTNAIGASFKLVMRNNAKEEMKFVGKNRGELRLAQTPNREKLLYQVFSASGEMNKQGEVKLDENVPTGWMNLNFKVTQWYKTAVEDESPRAIEFISGAGDNFLSAIHVSVRNNRTRAVANDRPGFWLFEGAGRNVSIQGKEYYVHFTKNQIALPFHIALKKFTIGMNPGTQKAASYSSDVIVKDPTNGVEKAAHISMNEPLVYGGYTFYQASYQIEEGRPPVSVFSVNRDSGRWIKYLGSLIMCLGITLMFYMNPHYWDILFGKKGRVKNA